MFFRKKGLSGPEGVPTDVRKPRESPASKSSGVSSRRSKLLRARASRAIDQDLACHWFRQDNAAGDGRNSVVSPFRLLPICPFRGCLPVCAADDGTVWIAQSSAFNGH